MPPSSPTPRSRRALRALAGLGLGLALAVAGLEVAARSTAGRRPAEPAAERVNYARLEQNSAGFHDREHTLAKPQGVHRLIVLGDSFTMGEWVPLEELFVTRLERALNESPGARPAEVISLALGGMDTRQEVTLLRRQGLAYAPDAVLLVFFVNDATNLDSNPAVVRRLAAELEQRRPPLGGWSVALDRLHEWWVRRRVTRTMLRDYRDSFFGSPDQQLQWERCKKALAGLKRLSIEHRFAVGVAIFPLLLDLSDGHPLRGVYREVARTCEQLGIPAVDLFDVFRGQQAESLWVAPRDSHPNARANALVVPALERFVVEAGLVPPPR
jgi:hypothetical protein